MWEIPFVSPHRQEYEGYQHSIDPEGYHSPELYAIWNSKAWLLDYTVGNMRNWGLAETDFYFWTDSGAFRDKEPVSKWPQPELVNRVFQNQPNRILLHQLQPFSKSLMKWMPESGLYPLSEPFDDHILGGFFGGRKEAIKNWNRHFTESHDDLLERKLFVGKEQLVMDVAFIRNQKSTLIFSEHLRSSDQEFCGDKFFGFQPLLSNEGRFSSCNLPPIVLGEDSFL